MSLTSFVAALSLGNLVSRLPSGVSQGIIWGIMALGVYITFRLLDIADLSVDGTFTTGAAVTVMLTLAGLPAWLAMIIAIFAGIAAGTVTGLLHTKLGIPAILSGILVQFALYTVNLRIMGMAANKSINPDQFHLVITMRNVPMAILTGGIIAVVLIVLMYWYFGTEQGSAVRATGSSPQMSRALGINTNTMKIIGLALSNGLVALAGGLMAQYQGYSDINMGRGAIVIGLAAVIIGEGIFDAIFRKGASFYVKLAFVILGTLLVNVIMILCKLTKTMWTDIWSIWHGNVLAGFVYAATGNLWAGVGAGILFLSIGAVVADLTAKDYQEFNQMPGISVPCTTSLLGLIAKPFNKLFDLIPGINKINFAPEAVRTSLGVFGELGVMGSIIGILIGIIGKLPYGAVLQLGISVGVLMVFLPKTVSVLCEGIMPIANSIVETVQDKFEGRELYVGVDCAALLGDPSVMASAVILYPLIVILSVILPGNKLLPIASLTIVPYWCGAVAAQFKGNIFRIITFTLIWCIPVFYLATFQAPIVTAAMASDVTVSCFDMGGDLLGAAILQLFNAIF